MNWADVVLIVSVAALIDFVCWAWKLSVWRRGLL